MVDVVGKNAVVSGNNTSGTRFPSSVLVQQKVSNGRQYVTNNYSEKMLPPSSSLCKDVNDAENLTRVWREVGSCSGGIPRVDDRFIRQSRNRNSASKCQNHIVSSNILEGETSADMEDGEQVSATHEIILRNINLKIHLHV